MIVQKDLKKLFHQLVREESAKISMGGYDVIIRILDKDTKLSLSTNVYFGGNFIPNSVRKCVTQKAPFGDTSSLKTFLSVDENNFQIYLNYLGTFEALNNDRFIQLLEEFSFQAGEWRFWLDEHDKNDLIHVRVPR